MYGQQHKNKKFSIFASSEPSQKNTGKLKSQSKLQYILQV